MESAVNASGKTRRKPESLTKLKHAARTLFVARGYDATRPQDIAREAGLGHGTFYLHYADKRACFLAFVEEARAEMNFYMREARAPGQTLEEAIAATLSAIHAYCDAHPGVLRAALSDRTLIDAGSAVPPGMGWGEEWSGIIREAAAQGRVCGSYDAGIIGQVVAGALHQAAWEEARDADCRKQLADNVTRFLVRALTPV